VIQAALVRDPIDPADVLARVGHDEDGAAVLFLGTVRNHADARPVTGITYEAYEAMAAPVLAAIAGEAADLLGTDRLAVMHRVGELSVGEHSVAIAASSPHRAQAFEASRYVIEEIKKRLPVWKKEHYVDGRHEWVAGTTPRPETREGGAEAQAGADERRWGRA
jgi:molybdopterin synthase catalytic subunit